MPTLSVNPIATALGAEISGVDLSEELGDAVIAEIREALLAHCVIFFRNQNLDVEQHKRLARRFGTIFVQVSTCQHAKQTTADHNAICHTLFSFLRFGYP